VMISSGVARLRQAVRLPSIFEYFSYSETIE